MPLPKRKFSQARRDKRRSQDHVRGPTLGACPQCGALKASHRVCPSCGFYRGRAVVVVATKAGKEKGSA